MVSQKGYTAGDIASEAGVPLHRVQYILKSRKVEPAGRVGVFRLFTDSDRQYILAELRRLASKEVPCA
jgi:hypothetical protein